MRRTNADKRRAVLRLLDDVEWAAWSDSKISQKCGVSQPFVSKLRPAPSHNDLKMEVTSRPRLVERGGTVYQQNTTRIGTAPRPAPAAPAWTPADVAPALRAAESDCMGDAPAADPG